MNSDGYLKSIVNQIIIQSLGNVTKPKKNATTELQ